ASGNAHAVLAGSYLIVDQTAAARRFVCGGYTGMGEATDVLIGCAINVPDDSMTGHLSSSIRGPHLGWVSWLFEVGRHLRVYTFIGFGNRVNRQPEIGPAIAFCLHAAPFA